MPLVKRKAVQGGRRDSEKVTKKGYQWSSSGFVKKSKGSGWKTRMRKQIDLLSSKKEHDDEESDDKEGSDDELIDLYDSVTQNLQEKFRRNRRFDSVEKVKINLLEDFKEEDVPSDDEMVNGVSDENEDDVLLG